MCPMKWWKQINLPAFDCCFWEPNYWNNKLKVNFETFVGLIYENFSTKTKVIRALYCFFTTFVNTDSYFGIFCFFLLPLLSFYTKVSIYSFYYRRKYRPWNSFLFVVQLANNNLITVSKFASFNNFFFDKEKMNLFYLLST